MMFYSRIILKWKQKIGDGTTVKIIGTDSEEENVAIIQFERCYAYLFGPPNDEAFNGHPLSKKGLKPYSVFEIKDSSWIREYEKMNSVHPYHNKESFMNNKKHYIFSFHDSVFECIASSYKVSINNISIRKSMELMIKEIR